MFHIWTKWVSLRNVKSNKTTYSEASIVDVHFDDEDSMAFFFSHALWKKIYSFLFFGDCEKVKFHNTFSYCPLIHYIHLKKTVHQLTGSLFLDYWFYVLLSHCFVK